MRSFRSRSSGIGAEAALDDLKHRARLIASSLSRAYGGPELQPALYCGCLPGTELNPVLSLSFNDKLVEPV